jgi:hypothetical protein
MKIEQLDEKTGSTLTSLAPPPDIETTQEQKDQFLKCSENPLELDLDE